MRVGPPGCRFLMSATPPAAPRFPPDRRVTNALPPWQRRTVVWGSWSIALSGLAWILVHYALQAGADGLPHPLEPWLIRWHSLSAMIGLFAAGLVGGGHVQRGWQFARRRATGLILCVAGAIVVVSGYALAYLVPETWHPGVGIGHAALGVLAFGVGVAHWRDFRRR
jgi:hypothetical protein